MDAVFIDLDGTLTDPKPGITGCLQYALERHGLPVPHQDELTWCIGPPMQESLRTLAGSEAGGAQMLIHYRERYAEVGLFENKVYDGIPEALAALRAAGPRLYVATSKPRVYAERILEHFGLAEHFLRIFGSELDGANVRKTDLLRFALSETGENPANAMMIGDREHDAIGARAHGIRPIGVLWGYGSPEELELAGMTRLLERPAQLATLL
ncbi:HAD family hydrolase [Emcibacter sp. SYSU 3D8]|uniref:HAD family hydrolase n=1 Tax=Emcibacter sp. SYSU 3D8 TaxID=3133969 RepID=UPI0031FE7BE3